MTYRHWLGILIAVNAIILFAYAPTLSISRYEVDLFFSDSYIAFLPQLFTTWFGHHDLALRTPFILLHLLNTLLLLTLAKQIVKRPSDLILVALLFMLLPGVNTAALVVNKAGFIIFFTLSFLLLHHYDRRIAYYSLIPIAALDNAFIILTIAIMTYGIYRKERTAWSLALIALMLNYYLFGFDDGGHAQGYFLDIFSSYAAIFSPLVFLFFIYTLYRPLIHDQHHMNLIWFISSIALIVSLILSLRQNISLNDFAPFAVIGTPIMVVAFYASYRIRLKRFRKLHALGAFLVLGVLVLNTLLIYVNKPLYYLLDKPKQHFAYKNHFASDIAKLLHKKGIKEILCDDAYMQKRLAFYGIHRGGKRRFSSKPFTHAQPIHITLWGERSIATFYISRS